MKVPIYSFAILALLAMAYGLEECPQVDGEWAVSIANPNDCSTFYKCDSGTPVLHECPGILEYNVQLGICDWPENANCVLAAAKK